MKRQIGLIILVAGVALAQPPQPAQAPGAPQAQGPVQPPPPQPARGGMGMGMGMGRGGGMGAGMRGGMQGAMQASRPPMERALMPGLPGRWWDNPQMVQKLGINSDQQKKMDDIFQQNRLKLIDLNATLQKEEVIMEPLVSADSPDEARILAQIDKVAQARAELEKANARFLLGIRRVLTTDQWKKLEAERPQPAPAGRRGMGGPGGSPGPGAPAPAPRPGR